MQDKISRLLAELGKLDSKNEKQYSHIEATQIITGVLWDLLEYLKERGV